MTYDEAKLMAFEWLLPERGDRFFRPHDGRHFSVHSVGNGRVFIEFESGAWDASFYWLNNWWADLSAGHLRREQRF